MAEDPKGNRPETSLGDLLVKGFLVIVLAFISAWVILSIHTDGH